MLSTKEHPMSLSRRRFVTIGAAPWRSGAPRCRNRRAARMARNGTWGHDIESFASTRTSGGEALIDGCVAEIARLEATFSLYRDDSESCG